MGVTEIDVIRSSSRVEESRIRMKMAIARFLDRTPWGLKNDKLSDEELQREINNCVKYEAYIGANYLTEVLEKRK